MRTMAQALRGLFLGCTAPWGAMPGAALPSEAAAAVVAPLQTGSARAAANDAAVRDAATTGDAMGPSRTVRAGDVLREIDDPADGSRWLVVRDPEHPAGPGRLLREAEVHIQAAGPGTGPSTEGPRPGEGGVAVPQAIAGPNSAGPDDAGPARARIFEMPRPAAKAIVIRIGDRVVVEEHSQRVDARLEAVAMSSAVMGSVFNARLCLGGRVVPVRATAQGRAVFANPDAGGIATAEEQTHAPTHAPAEMPWASTQPAGLEPAAAADVAWGHAQAERSAAGAAPVSASSPARVSVSSAANSAAQSGARP